MIVEALLPFLGAPNLNAVLTEPLHNKGRFVCNSADTVKHEYEEDVKLSSDRHGLDDLQLVPGFGTNLVPGHAFLLFLIGEPERDIVNNIIADFDNVLQSLKTPKSAAAIQQTSAADELKKFKELLDMGVITQEEFDAKKKQLLGL